MGLFYNNISTLMSLPVWLIIVASIWSIFWKGLALWKSAQLKQPVWFIALLVINTLGILEILYLFLFSKIKLDEKKLAKPKAQVRKKKGKIR